MTVRELIQQARIDRVEAEILLADIPRGRARLAIRPWRGLGGRVSAHPFADHAEARQNGEPLRTCWAIATFGHCAWASIVMS
ncbi:MAG: hypothetical protein CM15mP89_0130 [Gammaproteobacteria bacterium]|nr:MAG: hypothetical protein CM15mP89_0130 [Gammaproteobacteria bacterium]